MTALTTKLSARAYERQAGVSLPPFDKVTRVTINGAEVGRRGTIEKPRTFYSCNLGGIHLHPPLSEGDRIEVTYVPVTDHVFPPGYLL
ncbi:hypothetical protein [Ralstonia pseudosolanacearum]